MFFEYLGYIRHIAAVTASLVGKISSIMQTIIGKVLETTGTPLLSSLDITISATILGMITLCSYYICKEKLQADFDKWNKRPCYSYETSQTFFFI